jgi:hypothetical protein
MEENKRRRHIGVCRICGHAYDDLYYALIQCPHAAALWSAMRHVRDIPTWKGGGRGDWLDQWLLQLPDTTRDRVLMTAWRIWFTRNEVTHDKELPMIEGSR